MKYLICSICVLLGCILSAQSTQDIPVSFNLLLNKSQLVIADYDNISGVDPLEIEVFKFYISKVELFEGDERVFEEENSFHLLDAEDDKSLTVNLNVPEDTSFTHLRFNVGIDSLTNVSGAFGGDLDPTNGMYWTWQSGYINFKLEGKAESCPTRHNRFQYHIGGYQAPYYSLQTIELEVSNRESIVIDVALDKLFDQINIEETHQLMSPNEKSLVFSKLIPSIFSVSK